MITLTKIKPRVGIKNIATRCNVSVATVSHAFSGKRPVGSEIKTTILKTAKELGYEPNQWARNLLNGKTFMLGLILHDLGDNPFSAKLAAEIEHCAYHKGYQTWAATAEHDHNHIEQLLKNFKRMRMEGVIVCSKMVSDEQISSLIEFGIPVATLSRAVKNHNCTTVDIENQNGIRQVLQYLHDLGHRNIAYLGGHPDELTNQERLSAFNKFTTEIGLKTNASFIVEKSSEEETDRHQIERLLSRPRDYSAVVCFNDSTAFSLMSLLRQRGLDIPNDLSITGFDNIPASEVSYPALTSVDYNIKKLAEITVQKLLGSIENNQKITPSKIETQLVVRDSCKCLRQSSQ